MKASTATLDFVRTMLDRGEVCDPYIYVGTMRDGMKVTSTLINVLEYLPRLIKIERVLGDQSEVLWEGKLFREIPPLREGLDLEGKSNGRFA